MADLKINTYPMHIGDWHSGTSRMSLAERGAYVTLCNQYYLDQGEGWTLNECLRICAAMAKDEQKAVKAVLALKFEQIDGGYRHSGMDKRISEIKAASDRNQERARRAANARHHGRDKQCSNDATSNATSNQQAVLEECDPKAKSQKPIDKTDDDSASANDWPSDRSTWISEICRLTGCADVERSAKDAWPVSRSSREAIIEWNRSGVAWSLIIELIPQIIARKRDGPPRSFAYFTAEILQTHVNRTKPITLPEPIHDQRDKPYRTTGQRNEDSTVRAFQAVFGRDSDGQDEPVNPAWPDGQDGSKAPLRIAHSG